MMNRSPYPELALSCAGVWDRGLHVPRSDFHLVRGIRAGSTWRDIEKKEGVFDFSKLESDIMKGEGCFYTQIAVGPDSPEWLYSAGVPKVKTNDPKKRAKFQSYPYYLDPTHKRYLFRMIDNLASFLLQPKFADKLAFVEMDDGCTGDNVPYKGTPTEKKYEISSSQWAQFSQEVAEQYQKCFHGRAAGKSVPLMSNGVMNIWALKNIEPVGLKGSAYSRFHHLTGERSWVEQNKKNLLDVQPGNKFYVTRAEMDQTWQTMPVFKINEKLGHYWGIITGLNQGLLVHDYSKDGFDSMRTCQECFDLYNKYAGQIVPETASGGFIALHQGFDAKDKKWSEAGLTSTAEGPYCSARAVAVCKAHSHYGCSVDDPEATNAGQVAQRKTQKGYNDAGCDIWPDNYGRWITQVDADTTSAGLFRIGGKITMETSPYARFARGLRHKENKMGMYFQMHENFFKLTPVGNGLRVRVIWYDNAAGSWQLTYTTASGSESTAIDQKMTGSKQWKTTEWTALANAGMKRAGTKGSDFAITSKDSTDAIFHMIEVSRDERHEEISKRSQQAIVV